ncbi:MAG: lipoyl synthase [Candidatus Neomarinimicrobiota bacterium]|nr:MAG: lipoyl synthase [bacterium]|tara:strand:- start:730 stop:1602 length:873 start_codon:yes stop_codon:yes gene_type:complete
MKSDTLPQAIRKPKIKIEYGDDYKFVQDIVSSNNLHTVCEEARCPNMFECWGRGTATIMILGDICTRACGFCSVKTGKPQKIDTMEPYRTALAVKKMKLRHVVITSVDRDDLKGDFGSDIWAETIEQIHRNAPNCTVEVLTPDFQGYIPALQTVFRAQPEIFSHNVECVERISKQVRAQAVWSRSINVLKESVKYGLRTKTGIMLGLGETKDEVINTMQQIVDLGVEIFTIGQYLQPTKKHLPVSRYLTDDEFKYFKQEGLKMGFLVVESGALVRSSYRADEQARLAKVV